MAESKTTAQTIVELQKRYDQLNKQQIEAGANYKNASEQLEALKAQARKEHDTDDLDALKAKLKEMEAENERKRSEYQAHLEKIEADLKEVEKKFNQPGTK